LRVEKRLVDIRPFKAIHYTEKAGDPRDLITLPYDKIDSAMQKDYYNRSPYNYCRLILPVEVDKYEIARQRILQWTNERILHKDDQPAIFVFRQEFKLSGRNCVRTGLIGALRLYSYVENMVFPHEVTYPEPKADRLSMLKTVQKDLEPVFLIYSDPEKTTTDFFSNIAKTKPTVEVVDSYGIKHVLWKITDSRKIEFLEKEMQNKKLVITDGHHRYESAIAYRDDKRRKEEWTQESAFNFHMCYVVPIQDEGLVALPTHRLLKRFKLSQEALQRLTQFFNVAEIIPTVEATESYLNDHIQEHAVCIYDGLKAYGLILKEEKKIADAVDAGCPEEVCLLDVVVLRDLIFKHVIKTGEMKMDENILYAESTKSAFEKVKSGEAGLAFLVNPIDPKVVWEIAQKHWRLPEKSTNFYPKPVSGLVMMDISDEEKI
jgi:uncharacterized protein (DUF1015 family)